MAKLKLDHAAHVDMWRMYHAQVLNQPIAPRRNRRIENYVKDQMQEHYERLDQWEHV